MRKIKNNNPHTRAHARTHTTTWWWRRMMMMLSWTVEGFNDDAHTQRGGCCGEKKRAGALWSSVSVCVLFCWPISGPRCLLLSYASRLDICSIAIIHVDDLVLKLHIHLWQKQRDAVYRDCVCVVCIATLLGSQLKPKQAFAFLYPNTLKHDHNSTIICHKIRNCFIQFSTV